MKASCDNAHVARCITTQEQTRGACSCKQTATGQPQEECNCALTVDTSTCLTGDVSAAAACCTPLPSPASGPRSTPASDTSSLPLSCAPRN